MASFNVDIDLGSIIPDALQDESLALEMIKAGQAIMKSAIEKGASKHVRTGSMAKNVKASKPYINDSGAAVGKVSITGKDKSGMSNASKALWTEYGTKNQTAQPFVRPAIQSSQSSINAAMRKVYESKIK